MIRIRLHLHIHASIREDVAELVLENIENWNSFLLAGVTYAEQIPDLEEFEKSRDRIKKFSVFLIL